MRGQKGVAESAQVVQRFLPGKAEHKIRGGHIALEAGQLYSSAPEGGQGQPDLIHERRVITVEGSLHSLDSAG